MTDGVFVRRVAQWLTRGLAITGVSMGQLVAIGSADARPADIELGRYLASECLTCHRGATADSAIPNIFGMAETKFAEVVRGYRDRRLPNEVMQNIAGRLNDEDIASLALYFATTKKP